MKIFQSLKRVTSLLEPFSGSWAVCGGVAACIYRDVPRFTGDIDIALVDSPAKAAGDIARDVLKGLGYSPQYGFVNDKDGHLLPGQALVVGREIEPSSYLGVDFLLPILPWVQAAVTRAQCNLLDYGFDKLPTITPEDLCIAKVYAMCGTPERGVDRDDVLSMLSVAHEFDREYFFMTAKDLDLIIPEDIAARIPV